MVGTRAASTAVDQDVAAAIPVIDLVRADAFRAVVAEEAAAAIAGAVAAIEIPGERRGGRLIARREGADIEAGAPLRHAVVDEAVADDVERIAKQVERTAMRRVGLDAGIRLDQIALDRYAVLVGGVVEEQRAAAAATVLGENVALDRAGDIVESHAATDQRIVAAGIVVDVIIGDVEALRLVIVAENRLRVAGDLETVDRGEPLHGARVHDAEERAAFACGLADDTWRCREP